MIIVGRLSKIDSLIKRCRELYDETDLKYETNGLDSYVHKYYDCSVMDLTIEQLEEIILTAEEKQMSPYEYFQRVKSAINEMDDENIKKMYTAASTLMDKYKVFGQEKAEKRLAFHIKTLLKEHDLINLGINKFVYKDDITNFIDSISKKPVKIIEMKNYPREIPDEMLDVVLKTKSIFDEFYILFTDYSGDDLVNEVKKERDPILFGGFCTKNRDIVADRFYYLGDWEDEYCDLTLDKLISETSKDIVKTVEIPTNTEDLIKQLNAYEEKDEGRFYFNASKKKPFFKRIVTAIKGD